MTSQRNNWAVIIIAEGYWECVCVCPRQLVSKLAGSPVSSSERKRKFQCRDREAKMAVTMPAATAATHSCQSQGGCLSASMPIFYLFFSPFFFFCKVKGDDGCLMQTTTVRPRVTVPPVTPWGSVFSAPASCPHPRSMRVLKPETLFSVWWARIGALMCSLLVMYLWVNEYARSCRDKEQSHRLSCECFYQLLFTRNTKDQLTVLQYLYSTSVAASLQKGGKKTNQCPDIYRSIIWHIVLVFLPQCQNCAQKHPHTLFRSLKWDLSGKKESWYDNNRRMLIRKRHTKRK